jgi:hypothetical protein
MISRHGGVNRVLVWGLQEGSITYYPSRTYFHLFSMTTDEGTLRLIIVYELYVEAGCCYANPCINVPSCRRITHRSPLGDPGATTPINLLTVGVGVSGCERCVILLIGMLISAKTSLG